jgi:hypothetical protein
MKESAVYQKWRQENLAEGQDTERRSIALKMLAEGISLEVIAKKSLIPQFFSVRLWQHSKTSAV